MIKKYLLDNFLFIAIAGTCLSLFCQLALANAFFLEITCIHFLIIWSYYLYLGYQIPGLNNKNTIIILPILAFSFFYDVLEKNTIYFFISIGVLSLNYPKNKFWNGIRNIKYLKVFFISFIWTSVLISPLYLEKIINLDTLLYAFGCIYFFFVAICLPFDVRDISSDKGQIYTIPNTIGVKKTKLIAFFSVVISLIICGLAYLYNVFTENFLYSFLVSLLYSFVVIGLTNEKKKEPFYSFWVDFAMVVPLIVFLLINVNFHKVVVFL